MFGSQFLEQQRVGLDSIRVSVSGPSPVLFIASSERSDTAFVLLPRNSLAVLTFLGCVSSLWSFPGGEQTPMEPSNLSALKEEEEEDETSVGGGDQVRRAAPSAFSPDSIPPRPASQTLIRAVSVSDRSFRAIRLDRKFQEIKTRVKLRHLSDPVV
ncbi:hypothetical protein GW17_00017452 [Ensete ventricosum]|uniref:Uncharacterized protein n=1 Tax=Ensete ventricosum TaxID=4639 RepID=A0A444F7D5_ENSVE|nr:hypothetical protein GW17_00017452 [Ensete ventricosum]RZR75311.1 hypothetical protein BHM03_00054507 [Ensete ventricosum]